MKSRRWIASLAVLAIFGFLAMVGVASQLQSADNASLPSIEFELHASGGDGESVVSGWDGLLPGSLK